ncbi:MAG: nitroreductase family protein [Dehalococcoidia bacterium]|nr:MAG: nitroreductase family protein [Dehalococcoidia bacterium]
MDFFVTIRKRQSVRRFSDMPVAREDVLIMLEAATMAPSATNEQPWHFIVIQDRELKASMRDVVKTLLEAGMQETTDQPRRKRLEGMRTYSLHFADAPVAIAVLARPWQGRRSSPYFDATSYNLAQQSVAMAVAQFLLAATALGYSSCFASAPAEFARQELEALIGAKPPWFLMGIISLGKAEKQPQRRVPRKSIEEVCTFIG